MEDRNYQAIKILLDYGIDYLDFITKIVTDKNNEALSFLFSQGLNFSASTIMNEFGKKIVKEASAVGNLGGVKMLLDHQADFINESGNGDTPLSVAAGGGHFSVVELLLKKGAPVNDEEGESKALNSACTNNHLKIVEFLLENNANVNTKNSDGETPLSAAAEGGHLRIAELLVKKGALVNDEEGESKALYSACKNGEERMVKFLLKNNANVNTEGCLALSLELYNWEIVLELIDYGAAEAWVSVINNIRVFYFYLYQYCYCSSVCLFVCPSPFSL